MFDKLSLIVSLFLGIGLLSTTRFAALFLRNRLSPTFTIFLTSLLSTPSLKPLLKFINTPSAKYLLPSVLFVYIFISSMGVVTPTLPSSSPFLLTGVLTPEALSVSAIVSEPAPALLCMNTASPLSIVFLIVPPGTFLYSPVLST